MNAPLADLLVMTVPIAALAAAVHMGKRRTGTNPQRRCCNNQELGA